MRTIVAALIAWMLLGGAASQGQTVSYERGVVGLAVTRQRWDESRPWAKMKPETHFPEGVVIAGPLILTTARMIAGATFIEVEKFGRPTQATARPLFVDREVDLALLTVDTAGFFDDLIPVPLAIETPTEGALTTVRWHAHQLEALGSRVKRFEVQRAHFGELAHAFLLAHTDVSGGGWSEPVFAGGELVGLTVSQQEQRARVIPIDIIRKFIEMATGPEPYAGFPVLGAKSQINEDSALAAYLGQEEPKGVLVRQVPWGSSACGVLEPRDILLSVDGVEIEAGGFYAHPRWGQLSFEQLFIDGHAVGDEIPIRVMRKRREIELTLTLRNYPASMALVPSRRTVAAPPYMIVGGLVIRELDGNYLRTWGGEWRKRAPLHLLTRYYHARDGQRPDRRRVIMVQSVLPSPYNVGYQNVRNALIETINGQAIDSLVDVVDALEQPLDGFHVIRLEANVERREIVLDVGGLEQANAEILDTYRIPVASRLPTDSPPDGGPDCPGDY